MRPVDDAGHMVVANKPLRLGQRVYAPDKLPCPVQCAGCVILVNDRHDSRRLRMALSDGSAWVFFVREGETPRQDVVARPADIDLTPMVRAAVEAALPAMLPRPVKVVEQIRHDPLPIGGESPQLREGVKALAAANLEISEHLNRVLTECADLMERVAYLEQNALAKAEIKAA